ncbi:kyphoscoliosis peptidase-like isoform X1 [Lepisosteus oculatus]|uniref:kyphoscoliosis peptidase-like isoform X1 n=1 Tax=Lepisosteus oculatus TaxID=7918 RepID=UPI0035F52D59
MDMDGYSHTMRWIEELFAAILQLKPPDTVLTDKSLPYKPQDFKFLDSQASSTEGTSVEDVVSSLLRFAKTDLQKVRAVWTWMATHIVYDYENHTEDPQEVFKRRKAMCGGHAKLFQEMCRIAGVPCEYILGSCPEKAKSRHAWNAVSIGSQWHLVDVTWSRRDYYFLTRPEEFCKTHTPDDSRWNLLDRKSSTATAA